MRKIELTCAIVRDLLPSYVDGLTCAETNEAVEAHLAACSDCAALHAALAAPEEQRQEQTREVDYLKAVKRRGGRRVFLAILCTALVFALGIAAKLFVIGEEATREGMSWSTQQAGGALELRVFSTSSADAYRSVDVETNDGIVNITVHKVLVSPLYRTADERLRIPLDGVREVYLAGELLWQEGTVVFEQTSELFGAKTPYLGDVSAISRITELLPIRAELGGFTHSLKTDARPYRWTLEFTPGADGAYGQNKDAMLEYAPLMLALVENLDEVGWAWTDRLGQAHSAVLTLDEANAALPEWVAAYNAEYGEDLTPLPGVKDYADSPAGVQQLRSILSAAF